ncbi:MAG: roadblock/LC7 domain-containing protein [Limisphaerales bacterium]
MKTKFAGLLRGLLRRLDDNEADATAPQTPRVSHSPVSPVMATPVTIVHPQMAPPPASTTPAFPTPHAPVENPDELQLPLAPILAALTMDLRAKVIQAPPPGSMISLRLEKILTQLAFGSVKITFGELRQAAPGVFVNSGGEHDPKAVTLPLNEILTRLNPARLSRRSAQKHVEVTEEITGPFGPGGQGAKISNTKPTPSTDLTRRTNPQSLRMVAPVNPPPAQPIPVTPPPPAFVPRAITPASGVTTPLPSSMSHDTSFSFSSDVATPHSNGAPKPVIPPPPPTTAAPAPAAPVHTAPVHMAPAPMESGAISAPLTALSEHWPEGLRLEIIQSNLAHAQVLLPTHLIEPALKRGRITFTWRNLRPLIKPPPPASVHDGIELELPLSVIAPLFFARQKAAPRTQSPAQPPAEIPNLFFGFPQPESSPPPPPAKMPEPQPMPPAPEPPPLRLMPEPQPVRPLPEPPPARPALKPVDAKLADSNYYIWGDEAETPRMDETEYKHLQKPATDFASRYATPKEIVERAMNLPGVVGVVVALPDGLRVASQVPPDLNADTLAAFLPQIFDRVSQSTKELRMGSLNNFNFTVGNVPWRIFRVNAVYFAAFGKAGESLPSAQLAALAAELDRKKQ